MTVNELLASVASHLGFLDAYTFLRRRFAKSYVAILMYHRISPDTDGWSAQPLSLGSFEKQVHYLSQNYEILSLDAVTQYLQHKKSLPQKAVVITLDDGYKDSYLYAYPVLKKYGLPATIFLTTGCINSGGLFWWDKINYVIHATRLVELVLEGVGKFPLQTASERLQAASRIREKLKEVPDEKKNLLIERLIALCAVKVPDDLGKDLILSWPEIEEMQENNITFGAHTVTHPVLTKLSLKEAKQEIIQSKADIEHNLGQKVTSFCYPNGLSGDFNNEIVKILQDIGFTSAVTTIPGLITAESNPYELTRLSVSEDFNMFKVSLSNIYPDLRRILSRAQRN